MATHWKKLTNPNYLGAYSIENGRDIVLTIKNVSEETVTGTDGKKENCVVCCFDENVKPMILNATNMKTIQKLYKTPYIEDWVGKKIQIGIEKVKAFGEIVEALRVRKNIPQIINCSSCGNIIRPTKKFNAEEFAEYTENNYGKKLCEKCAVKEEMRKRKENSNAEQ